MQEKLKILLIEHDADFTQTVSRMLAQARDLAADVSFACDLQDGLSRLNMDQFDLVLFDVCIPDGAGLANVSVIRAEAPQLPIIVAGDTDDEMVALEAVQAGAQDYLVKSQLNPSWLERSIRYAIEGQRMDTTLLAAEKRYHSVFDHLVEGIFQTTQDGRYLMANAALARIYGYSSPDELIRDLTDIGRRLYVKEGRREEFVRVMQEHDTISGFESEVARKDSKVIWISENCRAVRDSRGQLLYYEGTVEDITQRRLAEERVRNSEELYHSLVETLPQNIFRKDLEDRFTFANQHFCRTLDRKLEEIVGKTDFDFFPALLARKYQEDDKKVRETGESYETVEEHHPPGHEKMFVQVVKTPLRNAAGEVIGLQGIFWDITQQRMADERIRRVNGLLAQNRKELRARNQQMQEDLQMAREIQMTMLPQKYPAFPPGRPADSAFQFTHRYLPSGTVGGDFFTVSALSENEAGVFICDVAGHGVRSALVTAMIRALVEELKPVATDPGRFLSKLNSDLCAILPDTGTPLLTTAFYLVADHQTQTFRYANAGHPRPLHVQRSRNQVAILKNKSGKSQTALGLVSEMTYETTTASMEPLDFLMLFTDGLYEVQAPDDNLYSQDLLLQAVQRRLQLPLSVSFDQVLDEVKAFSAGNGFSDDVCLVGVEFRGSAPAAGNLRKN